MTNKQEELREIENQIHRCLLLATSMPNTLSSEKAIEWIDKTVKRIMPEIDQALTQAKQEGGEEVLEGVGLDLSQKCVVFIDNHTFKNEKSLICKDCGLKVSRKDKDIINMKWKKTLKKK